MAKEKKNNFNCSSKCQSNYFALSPTTTYETILIIFLLPLAQKINATTLIPKPTVRSANENNVSNCVCVNFDLTYSINENN